MKRVYIDSCVLMIAFKAQEPEISDAAFKLLDDPEVAHLFSRITELELLPMPAFNRRSRECEFYQTFFNSAERVPCTEATIESALDVAVRNGLTLGDALHVACAISANAQELVTAEKRTRLPNAPDAGILIRTLRPE